MSRQYETVEPSVIDEEMLQEAVYDQGPKDEAQLIAKTEGIKYNSVQSLRLDFRNILKIENLWEFTALTKLQLNNNVIEKIEGLDHMVNLLWLDLSFNNIEVIQGLDKLTKLQDLTLHNNHISRIERLDTLTDLHVFSIGNNDIRDVKDILYLRTFKKLKTLNISNNPVCLEQNFQLFVIAFLPSLHFLDYQLISKETRSEAEHVFHDKIMDQAAYDYEAKTEQEAALKKKEELRHHQEAFVEHLNTDSLYQELFQGDQDGLKLMQMARAEEIVSSFKEGVVGVCLRLFEFGLDEHDKRQAELDMFWACIKEAKEDNKECGMLAIQEFIEEKKKFVLELHTIKDTPTMERMFENMASHLNKLWERLMMQEVTLVDQLEEVIKDFERNMLDHVSTFLEYLQACTSQLRELENTYYEKMTEAATYVQDKVAKNELDEEISEELKILLFDKDAVMSALISSHDNHMLKLDNKEDEIVTGIKTWLRNTMTYIHQEEEINRNRTRVAEINHMIEFHDNEISDLEGILEDEVVSSLVGDKQDIDKTSLPRKRSPISVISEEETARALSRQISKEVEFPEKEELNESAS